MVVLFTVCAHRPFPGLGTRVLGAGPAARHRSVPLTIAAGLLGALMLPDVTWAEALVLAIVLLAPTDAALGQAVVTDASLPSSIRRGLNIESGLNDGLCIPCSRWLAGPRRSHATTAAVAVRLVFEAIGWGTSPVSLRAASRHTSACSQAHGWIGGSLGPSGARGGGGRLVRHADHLGGSGFIAAFVGGVVFGIAPVARARRVPEELGGVLNGLTLIVFGAAVLGRCGPTSAAWWRARWSASQVHCPRGDRHARLQWGAADPLPGLVRTAWAGLDRVRCGRRRGRRRPPPRTSSLSPRPRVERGRARRHRGAAGARTWPGARQPPMESTPTPSSAGATAPASR